MKLLILSPVKDEGRTIEVLIKSVLKQSTLPEKWFIIDDGSKDNTTDIVKRYSKAHPFIELLTYSQHTKRKTGGNVVNVFNFGLEKAKEKGIEWDIVSKLDGDLEIQNNNFLEDIFKAFDSEPNLGITSGLIYHYDNNKKVIETKYLWHTQGQNKFYRKETLSAMNGLKVMLGWDGIDDILARHHGFNTKVLNQQEVLHFYKTRTRNEEGGVFNGLRREAKGYANRCYPFYMYLLKSIRYITLKPYIVSSVYYLLYSFTLIFTNKSPLNSEEKKAIRKFNHQRIWGKIEY